VGRDHDSAFTAPFPMLASVPMEYCRGGRLCLSWSNAQVVEELEPRLFAGCFQNYLGVAKGTLVGMVAVELAAGAPSAIVHVMAVGEKSNRLLAGPLTALGGNLWLRFQEKCAGGEL
jgi:hypothetical protein